MLEGGWRSKAKSSGLRAQDRYENNVFLRIFSLLSGLRIIMSANIKGAWGRRLGVLADQTIKNRMLDGQGRNCGNGVGGHGWRDSGCMESASSRNHFTIPGSIAKPCQRNSSQEPPTSLADRKKPPSDFISRKTLANGRARYASNTKIMMASGYPKIMLRLQPSDHKEFLLL